MQLKTELSPKNNMKKDCFVGFDTSNYTTSVAICTFEGEIVANFKLPLPVKSGEVGLRQSDAVFAHIKNLPVLCEELREALDGYEVLAVGVSSKPRSVEGSYMPCFLSGVVAAHAFSVACGAPIFEFSHQDGHVMAAMYSSGARESLLGREHFALHISGGTTELLFARPSAQTNGIFKLSLIGETADINAGQAIDRVGVMLGLSFPCGAELEKLAAGFEGKTYSARVCVREKDGMIECNLSGVENLAKKMYDETGDKKAVAAFVFRYIARTIDGMCSAAETKYGKLPFVFSGGVMSNKLMRKALSEKYEAYFAEPAFSADNAAGIALLCREKYLKNN